MEFNLQLIKRIMTLKQKALEYIAEIPDNKLEILMPLLKEFSENSFVIETNLTEREREIIAKGMKEYKKGTFIPLEDI